MFSEFIELPTGTDTVLVFLDGFVLTFFQISSGPSEDTSYVVVGSGKDHHLGIEAINVALDQMTPNTARIVAFVLLADKKPESPDDDFSAIVRAKMLYLKCAEESTTVGKEELYRLDRRIDSLNMLVKALHQ